MKKRYFFYGVLPVILLSVYLFALLRLGVWYGNTFLYRQNDGSYKGSDSYAVYQFKMEKAETGAVVTFAVNDTRRTYRIVQDNTLQIFLDETCLFTGEAVSFGGGWMLKGTDGEFEDTPGVAADTGTPPGEEALFPDCTRLYNWAVRSSDAVRGNLTWFTLALVTAIIGLLDLFFPNLFFTLHHRLYVEGGEPSGWYRIGQKIGRVLLAVCVVIFVIQSFAVH